MHGIFICAEPGGQRVDIGTEKWRRGMGEGGQGWRPGMSDGHWAGAPAAEPGRWMAALRDGSGVRTMPASVATYCQPEVTGWGWRWRRGLPGQLRRSEGDRGTELRRDRSYLMRYNDALSIIDFSENLPTNHRSAVGWTGARTPHNRSSPPAVIPRQFH